MTQSAHGDLLDSQVRAVEDAIRRSAIRDERFVWRLIDADWAGITGYELPAIVHDRTGFLFSIEYHTDWSDGLGNYGPAGFQYHRRPGIQSQYASSVRSWNEVLVEVNVWLRLIGRELWKNGCVRAGFC